MKIVFKDKQELVSELRQLKSAFEAGVGSKDLVLGLSIALRFIDCAEFQDLEDIRQAVAALEQKAVSKDEDFLSKQHPALWAFVQTLSNQGWESIPYTSVGATFRAIFKSRGELSGTGYQLLRWVYDKLVTEHKENPKSYYMLSLARLLEDLKCVVETFPSPLNKEHKAK